MPVPSQSTPDGLRIAAERPDIDFRPAFLSPKAADTLLSALLAESHWQQSELLIYGQRVKTPRLTAWYGDPAAIYVYSGVRNLPMPWTPLLQDLKHRIESTVGQPFNSVLLNYYRNGDDYISWHRDNERQLGLRPAIASVSLGATRRFRLRQLKKHAPRRRPAYDIELTHGSLLVMRGATQSDWEHGIAKAPGVSDPRINLTFRLVYPLAPQSRAGA